MDQLICASLSYTHYWYELGMFKVPATQLRMVVLPTQTLGENVKNHSPCRVLYVL